MASIDPEQVETRVLHELVDFAGASVVEVGAGDGRLTWRYAEHAREVLALEPVARSVRRARRMTPPHVRSRVRFEQADATTFSFPRSRFDVAVLAYSL